nr:unnamed protein product [Callosobruchus analis]
MQEKQESFQKLSTGSRRATNFNLGVHFFKKTLTQGTFHYHGPNFSNILPADLKCIQKFNEYKNKAKYFNIIHVQGADPTIVGVLLPCLELCSETLFKASGFYPE